MEEAVELKKIIDDLKSPRPFIRNRTVDSLMQIRDENMIPKFFKLISNEADFVKVQFCRWLGRVRGEMAVPPLIILLIDKSERVSREATLALDQIDNDRKVEGLMMLLRKGTPASKVYAIKSLGETQSIKAAPHLINLLSDKNSDIQDLAIDALRKIKDPLAINPLIRFLETNDHEELLYKAICALGEIGDAKTYIKITPFLEHESGHLRRAAIWTLSNLKYAKGIPRFCEMLKTDTSELVREELCKRLGKSGRKDVVGALLHTKAFDSSHNVRVFAEWALADIPYKEKIEVFLHLAKGEKHENLRGEAFLEIGRTGYEEHLSLLVKTLKEDKSEYVRTCVAQGLSFIPSVHVKSELIEALSDTELVRRSTADSLFHCATLEDASTALDMSRGEFGEDPYIQKTGLRMLEKIYHAESPAEDILTGLYSLMEAPSFSLKKELLKSLAKIGNDSTHAFLETLKGGLQDQSLSKDLDAALELLKKKVKKQSA